MKRSEINKALKELEKIVHPFDVREGKKNTDSSSNEICQ